MGILKGGVDLPESNENQLAENEIAVLKKMAYQAVKRGMTVPSILFLESIKPMNFIASQVLVFFEPIIQTVFNFKDYEHLRTALEKRDSIEKLVVLIEEYDAIALRREKVIKKYYKEQKKKWKWYQRYLGIFPPKVEYPDEIFEGIPKLEKPNSTEADR